MLTAYSCVIDVHRFYWLRLTMALVVCVCRWFGLISRVCLLYRLTNTEKCIQTISCAQLCQIDEIIALLWTSHKSVAQYSVLNNPHTHTLNTCCCITKCRIVVIVAIQTIAYSARQTYARMNCPYDGDYDNNNKKSAFPLAQHKLQSISLAISATKKEREHEKSVLFSR